MSKTGIENGREFMYMSVWYELLLVSVENSIDSNGIYMHGFCLAEIYVAQLFQVGYGKLELRQN